MQNTLEWLFQALVIGLTATLWWRAQRDLTARAAEARIPAAEDWERLRITVEQLMVELERRAVVAEQRIIEAENRLLAAQQRIEASSRLSAPVPATYLSAAPQSVNVSAAEHLTPEDDRYAAIIVLMKEGIVDPAEIARRTGLARGEIELYLSLRGRRMM